METNDNSVKVPRSHLKQAEFLFTVNAVLVGCVQKQLEIRFGSKQREIYIAASSHASGKFTMKSPLIEAAVSAGTTIDREMLEHEVAIANVVFKTITSPFSLCAAGRPLHQPSHQNLLQLCRFSPTLSVNSAGAERSFSTMKRLLTDYHVSWSDDFFIYLFLIFISSA